MPRAAPFRASGDWVGFNPGETGTAELAFIAGQHAASAIVIEPHRTRVRQVLLLEKGALHLQVDGVVIDLTGGMWLHLLAGTEVGTAPAGGTGVLRWCGLWLEDGDDAPPFAPRSSFVLQPAERADLARRLDATVAARPLGAALVAACAAVHDALAAGADGPTVRGHTLLFLAALARACAEDAAVSGEDAAVATVLAWMQAHPERDPGVRWLAEHVGLPERAFHRRFRAVVGQTPAAYLVRLRVERAQELLRRGLTVTVVATQLGYSSASALARQFHRLTGSTPSAWLGER